jgi:hypothetical protein
VIKVPRRQSRFRTLCVLAAMTFVATVSVVVGLASPANADPVCQQGGAYVLFARGSGSPFDSEQAVAFKVHITNALKDRKIENVEWAELGNLDGQSIEKYGKRYPDKATEYPAVPVDGTNVVNMFNGQYNSSVEKGKNELVTHLNDRYAGDGPRNNGNCSQETLVLGGYSQGADVVGWALRSSELSQSAKNHIGFVALYGDPKFNPGQAGYRVYRIAFQDNWWWVRGDDAGFRHVGNAIVPNGGFLGARDPYVPGELKGRFGSWCASGDAFCSGVFPAGQDIHKNKYQQRWISDSASEIAYVAKQKRDRLVQETCRQLPQKNSTPLPTLIPASAGITHRLFAI